MVDRCPYPWYHHAVSCLSIPPWYAAEEIARRLSRHDATHPQLSPPRLLEIARASAAAIVKISWRVPGSCFLVVPEGANGPAGCVCIWECSEKCLTNLSVYGRFAILCRRCDMKPVHWVGSSREDLKSFPTEVKRDIGFALDKAQRGDKHPSAKPLQGFGGGVFSKLSRIMMEILIEPFTPCALLRPSMCFIVSRRNRSVVSRHRRRNSTLLQRV